MHIYRERLAAEGRLTRDTDNRIQVLLDRFGNEYLEAITPEVWHRFVLKRFEGCTPATVQRNLGVMNILMKTAEDMGWIVGRPIFRKPRVFGKAKHRTVHLQPEEIVPVVEWIELNHGAMVAFVVLLLVDTGMRFGEAANLRWCDLGPEWVFVRRAERDSTKTIERRIPTSPRLLRFMDKWGIGPTGVANDRVIASRWRETLRVIGNKTNASLRMAAAATHAECGTDIKVHDLRHTFANLCASAGADLGDIKEMMGHSSLDMTMIYRGFVRAKAKQVIKEGMK